MSFETEKTIRNVLEFYQTSGLLPLGNRKMTVDCQKCFSVDGNSPHFEQLMFFILGHLLPEFIPSGIDCLPSAQSPVSLKVNLNFAGATLTSMSEMLETLKGDKRLDRLLAACQGSFDLRVDPQNQNKSLEITFPVHSVSGEAQDIPINFEELKARYEIQDLALTLLEGYVMNASRHVALLRTAMESQDWKEAHRHAHALKGGALNVCAEIMARKAKIIETLIKEAHYTEVPDHVVNLERACTELESAWAHYQEGLHD